MFVLMFLMLFGIERNILLTCLILKISPIQMNAETVEFCKKEISDLLEKKFIRNRKSPWSCSAFYVQKNTEIERGTP